MSTPGPGVRWLAARTGQDPAALLSSPGRALCLALVELAGAAARAETGESAAREAAVSELEDLRAQTASAPPPSEALLGTVAAALRDAAERLRPVGHGSNRTGRATRKTTTGRGARP